jgi:hypothetical protein
LSAGDESGVVASSEKWTEPPEALDRVGEGGVRAVETDGLGEWPARDTPWAAAGDKWVGSESSESCLRWR